MLSLQKIMLLVTMVAMMITWVSRDASATPLAPYPSGLEERARQDIITLAARIIKLAMNGPTESMASKRNGGTLDTLYNLPDLSAIGRR